MPIPCRILCLSLACLGLIACGDVPAPNTQDATRESYLVAVNSPLAYFARRLLGPDADVRLLAPADSDPAMWSPDIAAIQTLQDAELVLLNGAGYSPWLDRVALSGNRLVVTAADRSRWIALSGQVTHSHGPEGEHAHGGYAFTTWMDLSLAAEQAATVAASLQTHFPERAAAIADRATALLEQLASLDAGLAAASQSLQGRALIYSHPVYQYFEARYGLPGQSLHWEPDVMPEEAQWRELRASNDENALFVWEATPDAAIAAKLTALGIAQVVVDPGANHSGDWLSLQRQNLDALQRVAELD